MARIRDYKEEYRRRLAKAAATGLSRSQARGHPKRDEAYIKPPVPASEFDERLNRALRVLRATHNQTLAAKSQSISVKRFRRFLRENQLARWAGRRWELNDMRPREVLAISDGQRRFITVAGFEAASEVMQHRAAVRTFLDTNNISHLQPWEGWVVADTSGQVHQLETRPNVLYRLAAAGSEGFENVYRLIQ